MLTDKEADAVFTQWCAKSARAKAATAKKADRLRVMAHAAPPFQSQTLETWRLRSFEICQDLAEGSGVGEAAAIEVATLEKLFSDPRVKAWESAYRFIQMGLDDPHIRADAGMRSLFKNLLIAIEDTADYGDVRQIVGTYLIDDDLGKELLSRAGRINGRKPHVNHMQATARLPHLWDQMKADGKSKNEAAPLIADRLGLAETTVRKKLQGLN
jgi:hypothetical protein